MTSTFSHDYLRAECYARALALNLSPTELAGRCEGQPSAQHIATFLQGRCSMSSPKAGRLLRALGLRITPEQPRATSGK